MKLISCHIENFGKISNQTINFADGMNVFCEGNGWGKTTLASFILTMFYGFAGEGKHDEYENERKRFKPWQGGVYGGSLTFEADGKEYVIVRTFGSKAGDDNLELRDSDTNLLVPRTQDEPGEMFFGIDRKSFCRTAFIRQNDCVTQTTDGINAKLGNLADNTDDINNYEKVESRLNDLLNSMSPRRATGSINKQKNKIVNLETEIRQAAGVNSSLEILEEKIREKKEEAENCSKKQKELQDKRTEITTYNEIKSRQEKYESYLNAISVREEKLESAKSEFNGVIPEENSLLQAISDCQRYESIKVKFEEAGFDEDDEFSFNELGKIFDKDIPSKEELNLYIEKADKLNALKGELAEKMPDREENARLKKYEEKFGEEIPSQEIFSDIKYTLHEREERKNNLNSNLLRYETLKELPKEKKKSGIHTTLLTVGILVAIAGIGVMLKSTLPGIVLLLTGIVLVTAGFVGRNKARKACEAEKKNREDALDGLNRKIEEDKLFISSCDTRVSEFLGKYGIVYNQYDANERLFELKNEALNYVALREKCDSTNFYEYENRVHTLENELISYTARFEEYNTSNESYSGALYNISRKADAYETLSKRRKIHNELKEEYDLIIGKLDAFFFGISTEPDYDNILNQLLGLKSRLQTLTDCFGEYRTAKEKLDAFAKEVDIQKLYSVKPPAEIISLEEIDSEINSLAEQKENINDTIREYRRQVEIYSEKKDILTEKEAELEILKESYEKDKKKYSLIKLTKEYLEKSKTSFTAKYMEPIMMGYRKYYGMISGESADNFYIDADTNLTMAEQGLQRETRFFSTGCKDLIGVCMRMALVDAMYEEEKPFVVFDDPFVNLDEEKTEKGKEFLKAVADEYQVIYFTCHKDRV